MQEKYQELMRQKEELGRQLQDPVVLRDPSALRDRSIEHARIEKRLALIEEEQALCNEIEEHERAATGSDPELVALAAEELKTLHKKSRNLPRA